MNEVTTKKQSWWQLLSIQAAGAICLPVIMAGQLISQKYGWQAALLGMGVGNVFLLLIGFILATLSSAYPKSTVQHAVHYFGNQGGRFFALMMILSMLGWYAIQLNVMSLSLQQFFHAAGLTVSPLLLNIGLGGLLAGVLCFGMKTLKWLSNFIGPLLVFTLVYTLSTAKGIIPEAAPLTISWLGGVSLIVGTNIAGVIDLPTFFQHAKSRKDAWVCILFLYGLVVPFIEGVGIYLAAVTGGNSILEVLQAGHNWIWMIWVSGFVLLSGWATNNANLYSAVTSSYSLFGKFSGAARTLLLGCVGTIFACFNPLGNLEGVLDLLGITIGSMGAVILSSYLFEKFSKSTNSFTISMLCWSLGVSIGLCSSFFHFFITGVPVFDAFLGSAVSLLIIKTFYQRKNTYEAIDNR